MRIAKLALGLCAAAAVPASACPFDGMYGHRFSSIMSEYRGGAEAPADYAQSSGDSSTPSQDASNSNASDQASSSSYDAAQGDPTR